MECMPGVRDVGGVEYGGVYNLGSREAVREEGGGVGVGYSVGRMGIKELGRKTRVLAITVSAR
jgi:hypothetical protein